MNCHKLIILITTVLFYACSPKANEGNNTEEKDSTLKAMAVEQRKNDSIAHIVQREKELFDREREELIRKDSILFNESTKNALSIAKENMDLSYFRQDFGMGDSTRLLDVRLLMGYLFSKQQKHLIVRRENRYEHYIDVFLVSDNKFVSVLNHKESDMTYTKDTLQDVNGDGFKDFLVNWYGSTGCCLKNFYNVYLFQPETGKFSDTYEFINPTFSPKEKIIRGVKYGHSGSTPLYKYKWNGMKVDTIEFIYPDEKNKGDYIKSDALPWMNKYAKETKIKTVPKEYVGIYGYDWFLGKY